MKHHLQIFLNHLKLERHIEERLFRDRVVPLPPGPIFNLSGITLADLPIPNFKPWPGFLAGAPQPPPVVEPPSAEPVVKVTLGDLGIKPPIFGENPPVPPTFIPKP